MTEQSNRYGTWWGEVLLVLLVAPGLAAGVALAAFLLLLAFAFRVFVALRLPNDTPDDGRVYAQIARNVL